jgi:hypothetical protein
MSEPSSSSPRRAVSSITQVCRDLCLVGSLYSSGMLGLVHSRLLYIVPKPPQPEM